MLLAAGGWTVSREWTDEGGLFGVVLAEARAEERAP
jgi:hypothetical protein